MMRLIPLICLALTSITTTADGHEFWIDPESFFVKPGAPIRADLRVGEEFRGTPSTYLPSRFRRFEIASGNTLRPVEGTLGDRPALRQVAGEGLAVVIHETTDSTLKYTEFPKFQRFVDHKDALWTVDEHRARGLPEDEFGELYSRYAKSLVAVGSGAGADRNFGLVTEIVALDNPYTDDLSRGMSVQVLYQGAPRQNAQVEVFERAPGGSVRVFTVRTNGSGVARIPVKSGHRYMLDSVVLRAPAAEVAERRRVVWESLWANLTFAVPE